MTMIRVLFFPANERGVETKTAVPVTSRLFHPIRTKYNRYSGEEVMAVQTPSAQTKRTNPTNQHRLVYNKEEK
jgi:hypothetical protein